MSRCCAKPGCNGVAGATLTYDYGNRTANVALLAEAAHPMQIDLCIECADAFRVPVGWDLVDRRLPVQPLFTGAVAS